MRQSLPLLFAKTPHPGTASRVGRCRERVKADENDAECKNWWAFYAPAAAFFWFLLVVTMRRLIHIPIIHAAADLGSLSRFVQEHYTRVCGKSSWNQREDVVQALWADIRANLDALCLDAHKTRIYQDGLPICGFEERIVRELAKAGSSNHQLILRLLDQGAILMGTEDSQLLMEEYEMQKRRLTQGAGKNSTPEEQRKQMDRVLKARDSFIAERIAATLQEGEAGLLFLGALHRLDALRSTDIRVETLGDALHKTVRRPRS